MVLACGAIAEHHARHSERLLESTTRREIVAPLVCAPAREFPRDLVFQPTKSVCPGGRTVRALD